VATETDAARDRVIEARADFEAEFERLEASARAAVDIPAKIRNSPLKAAAVAGGAGFLALKGPQRLFGAAKRAVRGPSEPLPASMLPEEIEKALRALGDDGDRVRGALERDFANYAKQAARDRTGTRNLLLVSIARPILTRGAKVAADWFINPDLKGFDKRLAQVRERTERDRAARRGSDTEPEPGRDDLPPAGV
jgi:hypothetical protein